MIDRALGRMREAAPEQVQVGGYYVANHEKRNVLVKVMALEGGEPPSYLVQRVLTRKEFSTTTLYLVSSP